MILVDFLVEYGEKGEWCHLASDLPGPRGLEELHAFAAKIGLKRWWFQDHPLVPHYDLRPSMRKRAIKHGAQQVSALTLTKRCRIRKVEDTGRGL